MIRIVIDTLGADMGMEPIALGTARALQKGLDIFPVLVGPAAALQEVLDRENIASNRYALVDTDRYIRNEDPPTCIFGGCDDTSMVLAYQQLKKDPQCDAMLSAGSTGALLVGSICRLGLLPGLKFPVLASALPTENGKLTCLVDCGANIECTADDLVRFARMGEVFSRSYCGIDRPRVALMNVGREKQKGTALLQQAYEKISALDMNFVGNVEGSDLVSGYADVIVADGFSGNVLLKCAEAVGKTAARIVESFSGEADPQLIDRICRKLLAAFDFNSQGAATFLGPKKTVVKMHGSANADTVVASIEQILRLEKAQFSQAMSAAMK